MSDTVIRMEGLGKRYFIAGQQAFRPTSLREALSHGVRRWACKVFRRSEARGEQADAGTQEFWALKDISFEVKRGEVVGLVGRNGAGKSTLLKIISRITTPTEGRLTVRGRIVSLLEVGTGFHPDLTGRENLYLNGAILGMTRAEIRKKFDEIVAFAEVETFLDTPVKFYSSGMYARLAFSVAAHLDPDILILDEVLAVGDTAFQTKCLGKMRDVAGEGRTVLFVSHNMAAVNRLCQRALLLEDGRLVMDAPTEGVVSEYLMKTVTGTTGESTWPDGKANQGVTELKVFALRVYDGAGRVSSVLDAAQGFLVEIEYRVYEPLPRSRVGLVLSSADGATVFDTHDADTPSFSGTRRPGWYRARCAVPANLLNSGRYVLSVNAGIPHKKNLAWLERVLEVLIEDRVGLWAEPPPKRDGIIRPDLRWEITDAEVAGGVARAS
jgi:lipopolysaccharide transport system ATP-binding protein